MTGPAPTAPAPTDPVVAAPVAPEPAVASALDEATARVGDRWTLLLVQALL